MSSMLYVTNLAFDVTENDLRRLFEDEGDVQSVEMVVDNETGNSRGIAYVEMKDDRDAVKAIQRFQNYSLRGKNMQVVEAPEKK